MTSAPNTPSISIPELGHELNNMLMMVNAHLYLLEESLAKKNEKEIIYRLGQTKLGVEKMGKFTAKFCRNAPETTATNFDMAYLLRRMISFIKVHPIFENVTIRVENTAVDAKIFADETEIQHIFLNLLKNAAEAVSAGDIVIQFSNPSPRLLRTTVQDRGPGLPDFVLQNLFHGQNSTKGHGHGFGLGVVHKLIIKNQGSIRCETKAGIGTTFTIYFPVS